MAGGRNGFGESYSANCADYQLLEEVGNGATATVFRAIYLPFNEIVAVKCLDPARCNINLDDVRRDAQTMSLSDHPNVIRARCSFVVGHSLWVVMPFMDQGSCLDLMKIAFPYGFEEDVIGSILKETLKGLGFLHAQGQIHRDIKAGNVLLDGNGAVKLACMFDSTEKQRSKCDLLETPCWMAPEVLIAGNGFSSKADIWSFGITALELAHGHAPFLKYTPQQVLTMTIQDVPSGLSLDREKKFSKSFKEMIGMCLVKDQTKRPTAEKLIKHSFFKNVKTPEHLVKNLFVDLPPLWNRAKALQLKDAAQIALKKIPLSEQEALSQKEYNRGVSEWNYDIDAIRTQEASSSNAGATPGAVIKNVTNEAKADPPKQPSIIENEKGDEKKMDGVRNADKLVVKNNGSCTEAHISTLEKETLQAKPKVTKSSQTRSISLHSGPSAGSTSSDKGRNGDRSEIEFSSLLDKGKSDVRKVSSFNGPIVLPNRASANSFSAPNKTSGDEKSKTNLVQIKGRFSVTSENLDIVKDAPIGASQRRTTQTSPMKKSASVGEWKFDSKQTLVNQTSKDASTQPSSSTQNCNAITSVIASHLQNMYLQNSTIQDSILNLMGALHVNESTDAIQNGKIPLPPNNLEINGCVEPSLSDKEKMLTTKIAELQAKMTNLTDELNAEKEKYAMLKAQLDSAVGQSFDSMVGS